MPDTSDSAPTTPPRKPTMRGAAAGSVLLAAIIACAAVGYGLGALAGAAVPLGLAGLFAGVVIGIVLVANRFGDI